MPLRFQDPTNINSPSLHEALLAACDGAISGAGTFAFVTMGGIRLYFQDPAFSSFIQGGTFELVIGIDEITNTRSLDTLSEIIQTSPNLSVSAFAHNHRDSLYHPKFVWFRKQTGGVLVIGSGNLTVKGLRNNWEGFSVINLNNRQLTEVVDAWNSWKHNCQPFFLPITHNDVTTRVQRNAFRRRPSVQIGDGSEVVVPAEQDTDEAPVIVEESEDMTPWQVSDTQPVLVAEIPAGGNRWNQANFNQEFFESFFGGTVWDNSYRILLRVVETGGGLQEIENRQAVSVQSHNWRFELGAAAGLAYPAQGRPIGVFIRVGIRMFLYILVMPGSEFYNEVDQYLVANWHGRTDRMRRVATTVAVLRGACPSLPFWSIDLGS
jgi:hypothetical protein